MRNGFVLRHSRNVRWIKNFFDSPDRPARRATDAVEMGRARALACGGRPVCRAGTGRRPRRPHSCSPRSHRLVYAFQHRSDRRGAGRHTRGRVCSPILTAYSRLGDSQSKIKSKKRPPIHNSMAVTRCPGASAAQCDGMRPRRLTCSFSVLARQATNHALTGLRSPS